MAENRRPGFMFYPDKWCSHTKHLSDAAYRVYHTMLCWMWEQSVDYCTAPSEPSALSAVLGEPLDRIKAALQEIQNPHAPLLKHDKKSGRLISNGLKKEIDRMMSRSQKARESANIRWRDDEDLLAFFCKELDVEPRGKRGNEDWQNALRLMVERDKRDPGEVREVVHWVSQDVKTPNESGGWRGWRAVIKAPAKLRLKYDTLLERMCGDKQCAPATTQEPPPLTEAQKQALFEADLAKRKQGESSEGAA